MDRATRGMNTWRAGCGESRTSGSESGPQKPTSRNADRALRPDFYTEHPTAEGKLYLCTFKDLWSNRIVGYSIADRMTAALAIAAIRNAGLRRDCEGVIVHTDRGSQFRARAFVSTLEDLDMVGSMGRVGACGDNASAESFFSLLQKNVLNRQRWQTRDELRLAIVIWIEAKYHRRRRQRALGKLTPIEFETIHQPAPQAA